MLLKICWQLVIVILVFNLAPKVMTTVVFATYIYKSPDELTSAKAFAVLSTFGILEGPIRAVPRQITNLLETNVSFKRIQKYLLREEIDTEYLKELKEDYQGSSVTMNNGFFFWNNEGKKLEDIEKEKDKKKGNKNGDKKKEKDFQELSVMK